MKTRRLLHDLDLARIAPLPPAEKRVELSKLKQTFPLYNYKPFRLTILDILNVQAGPLAVLPPMPWEVIENAIRHWTNVPEEIAANLAAAKGLYDFATEYKVMGKRQEFYPLVVDLTEKVSVSYWAQVVLSIDGRPVVPLFDPRKSSKLTPVGRLFAMSAMHQRIRVLESDFEDVGLAVFQFSNPKKGPRIATPYFADDLDRLYSYEELLAMVRETYVIWNEILDERKEEARRSAPGGSLI